MRQHDSALTVFVTMLLLGASIGAGPATSQEAGASTGGEGARVFLDNCSVCHTIGGGELAGPDLADTAEMDRPTIRTEVERMQDYAGPLSDEQIDLLVDLLASPDAASQLETAREAAASEEENGEAAEDDVASEIEEAGAPVRGAALFFGERRLANGGLACSACHRLRVRMNTGGGTFASELTDAVARLGPRGLVTATERASFPVMQAAYRDRPVTHEEALDLAAFLTDPSAAGSSAVIAAAGDFPVGVWAALVTVAGFALIALLYRGRNQRGGGVRRRLIERHLDGSSGPRPGRAA